MLLAKRGHNLSGFSRASPPTRNDLSPHFLASMSPQATACAEAVLVVGSDCDPAVIMNSHIRVHAAEGRLFRTVIEQALTQRGIPSSTFVERMLLAHAAQRVLRRSPAQLKDVVARLRPVAVERWRAEEKVAAIPVAPLGISNAP